MNRVNLWQTLLLRLQTRTLKFPGFTELLIGTGFLTLVIWFLLPFRRVELMVADFPQLAVAPYYTDETLRHYH
jgi:hypothetical protein